jgi:hypothetical protein
MPGRSRSAAADAKFTPQVGLPAQRICLARVPDPAQSALAPPALVGAVARRPLMRELPRMVVLGPFALETADLLRRRRVVVA